MDINRTPWSPSAESRVASSPESEPVTAESEPVTSGSAESEPTAAEAAASPEDEAAARDTTTHGEPVVAAETTTPIAAQPAVSDDPSAPAAGTSADPLTAEDSVPTGRHAKDDPYEQNGSAPGAGYGQLSTVPDGETAGDGALTGAVADSAAAHPHAADSNGADSVSALGTGSASSAAAMMPGSGDSAAEWSEVKALFVDDPSASVQRASALVEQAVEGFMSSLRQRRDSLSGWQEGDATGTEELRKALRGYRILFDELEQISRQVTSGAPSAAAGGPAAGVSAPGVSSSV